jgi:hypothetical protein
VAKTNHRATLDVATEMLPLIGAILPPGFYIAGSDPMRGGAVRLVLEGEAVTEDGVHLQAVVTMSVGERRVKLEPAEVKGENA